jgi:uncharacterized protein (TIGR02646 family)
VRRLNRGPCPHSLDGPQSRGGRETVRAIDFFSDSGNAKKRFEAFESYRSSDVSAALREMGGGKCAYCEGRYDATAPADREHFRPKGEVLLEDGTTTKPGYYWLAAAWLNLLPSCYDCNRVREHADGSKSGKGSRFPLADEKKRAARPGDETREAPLLIDPSSEDPEMHVDFSDEGICTATTSRGLASVEVYGLNRIDLVANRRRYLLRIRAQLTRYRFWRSLVVQHPRDESLLDGAEFELKELMRFVATDAEYTLFAKTLISRACPELNL